MKSGLFPLPLVGMALFMLALLLLDLAFYAAPELLAAFVPILIWSAILVVRGRG